MLFDIRHHTHYDYSQPVSLSHHLLHLRPRLNPHQRLLNSWLRIDPAPAKMIDEQDFFDNPQTLITLDQQHDALTIEAGARTLVERPAAPDPALTPAWESVVEAVRADRSPQGLRARMMSFASDRTRSRSEAVTALAAAHFTPARPILEAALALTAQIHQCFDYDSEATTVITPVDEVIALGRGVCQDFAHLQLACLRSLGLSARYVSGYLLTHPPPGEEKLVGADASHAWVSLWVPGAGWIDIDPTNNLVVGNEHITLAWGRDYADVSPINGVMFGGGKHQVNVAVDVTPAEMTGLTRAF